jgi:hypothetical protein
MKVMGQLHVQADLAQSSSPCTHQIGGLLGSEAGLENLKLIKKNPLPLFGIEKSPLFESVTSQFTDHLTMVK